VSGNDGNQEIAEWILPGGRTIPVYSSLTSGPTVQEEDPLSLDGENSSSRISRGKLQTSTTQQSDVDLMTDEEIPPRGEISEYEESNTSSHQSDELVRKLLSIIFPITCSSIVPSTPYKKKF